MAAPHIAGVLSLMVSLDPSLNFTQSLQLLQSSARAFPAGSNCNTSTCGSGIADAAAALNAVLNPPPTSTAGPSPTPSRTNTPGGGKATQTPTLTRTPTPSRTPTQVSTSTFTASPTNSPTVTATFTEVGPTPTPTWTGTATLTATPTHTLIPSNTPGTGDLIFADGFESGNLAAWSSSMVDGGDLSVSPSAALVGSQGLQAVIDDNNTLVVIDDTPTAETR